MHTFLIHSVYAIMHCWKENLLEIDILFKNLKNILDFKISFLIFANGRNFGHFCLSKIHRKFKRLEYGCVLYSFKTCYTEISNVHFM